MFVFNKGKAHKLVAVRAEAQPRRNRHMARSEMQNLLEGNAILEVHSDENLGPGDAVLETPNGDVDARLATQMDAIKRAVQDVMS